MKRIYTFFLSYFILLFTVTVQSHPVVMIPTLPIGHITLTHPIMALLGNLTMSLSIIASHAYQKYMVQPTKNSREISIPEEVILAERLYYEQRKKALQTINHEYMTIKRDIEMLHELSTYSLFRCHSYQLVNPQMNITAKCEKKLSLADKKKLRQARKDDLTLLEQHIEKIQLLLALQINQLINNLNHAQQAYDVEKPRIDNALLTAWDIKAKVSQEVKIVSYKLILLEKFLLQDIQCALKELQSVATYYQKCTSECIKKTTTIIPTLQRVIPLVAERTSWVDCQEKRVTHNIDIAEQYFKKYGIVFAAIKTEAQKIFDKKKKEYKAQILKALEKEIESGSFSGGPKKDDGDEKEPKQLIKICEDDVPHMFDERPGHLIDTPKNRILLIDLVSNKINFLGIDIHGSEWYAKIINDGRQLWAVVRNNLIRNGGINEAHAHRSFHPKTGLCKPFKLSGRL